MDVVGLVRQAAPIGYASLQRGIISGGQSHPKAAPTAFTEAVLVILPEASTEHLYGPLRWPALHGTSKPQPGAECVVGFDEQNRPSLLWWEGPQTEPVPAAESITEAELTSTVQHKLLGTTGPAGKVERAVNTAYEPSTVHNTFVNITLENREKAGVIELQVNGVYAGTLGSTPAIASFLLTGTLIYVAAALKWEAKLTAGEAGNVKLYSSYTFAT